MKDQTMGKIAAYIAELNTDLADQRFALFVSEPLRPILKNDMGGTISEEKDGCTIWVAAPTLCYHQPIYTSKDVHVQLLVPRANLASSQAALP